MNPKNQTGPPAPSDPGARLTEILKRIQDLRAEFEAPEFDPWAGDYRDTFSRFNSEISALCEAMPGVWSMYAPLLAQIYSELILCIGALSRKRVQAGPDRKAMGAIKENFSRYPNGPALKLFGHAFSAASLDTLFHSQQTGALDTVSVKGSTLEISKRREKSYSMRLEVKDFATIISRQNQTDKVFMFLLSEVNRQCVHGGKVTGHCVTFNLEDMVKAGLYTNRSNARRGFLAAFDDLSRMELRGRFQRSGGADGETISGRFMLFTGTTLQESKRADLVSVFLNSYVDWTLFTTAFTIIPNYYYSLGKRPRMLLLYLCHLARNNIEAISEGKPFRVSFPSVGDFLGLPDPGNTRNPYRDTVGAIEQAVTDIELANGKHGLHITPVYDVDAPVATQWAKGYLEVLFFDDFAEPFKEYAPERAKKIAAGRKRATGSRRKRKPAGDTETQEAAADTAAEKPEQT